jgi:hypothetical protein
MYSQLNAFIQKMENNGLANQIKTLFILKGI